MGYPRLKKCVGVSEFPGIPPVVGLAVANIDTEQASLPYFMKSTYICITAPPVINPSFRYLQASVSLSNSVDLRGLRHRRGPLQSLWRDAL